MWSHAVAYPRAALTYACLVVSISWINSSQWRGSNARVQVWCTQLTSCLALSGASRLSRQLLCAINVDCVGSAELLRQWVPEGLRSAGGIIPERIAGIASAWPQSRSSFALLSSLKADHSDELQHGHGKQHFPIKISIASPVKNSPGTHHGRSAEDFSENWTGNALSDSRSHTLMEIQTKKPLPLFHTHLDASSEELVGKSYGIGVCVLWKLYI